MDTIKVLGAQGGRSKDSFTTSIMVTKNTVIDAGNIMQALDRDAKNINKIFFSHSHLDHIVDSAFLIDNSFATREEPLYLYGLPQTIKALKKHLFNSEIWPDFSEINLINTKTPSVVYVELELYKKYELEEGVSLTPLEANHTVECCGYLIEGKKGSILFSGDTFKNPKLWDIINSNESIKALIIDVSFPNKLTKIAQHSKHLTPHFLREELELLKRKDVKIYINHLKPFYHEEIIEELFEIGISRDRVLNDSEEICFKNGLIKRVSMQYTTEQKIQKLNKIGTALSAETNIDALLEIIVTEAKILSNADAGTLYILEDKHLHFKVAQTDSLGIKMGGISGAITWPPLPLYLQDSTPNNKMVAATCALSDIVINIPDVYEAEGFSFDGTRKFDEGTGYRSKSMLVIPLKNHESEIIGVLQLLNKYDDNNETIAFDKEDEELTLSLASQAAIAITNTTLIQGLETLLEAFLQSIIFAIGKKSPYTAGHIERMVKLTVMIAEAIDKDKGVFSAKSFSAQELKQINFAALMHDIGKLATPEQVVDKSTKLETIFDRIEVVKGRIEIIKKALEIELLNQKITLLQSGKTLHVELESEFSKKTDLLDSYFEVIQKSNRGTEFTNDEQIAIIQNIASQNWEIDGKSYLILTENEAYNLSVQKGTLTSQERAIINEHAKISIDILNKLPFPKKYKEIPQISGNHHEKINGKGYPLGLSGDEISFEARILAVADVFEALTASDRPYKKGNPLSSAMKILYFMAKDDDLDRDIVKFFYNSGLYLQYAKKLLPKESIDEVTTDFSSL
ncbi:metal dependent phosphohydrolase [Sulfurimonas denitrificans DSM 1251]|uniref:Metal dependent phosphohydrolase n=1 Tax=Sulfurimonas denitrificans (strain ATCC 33889 / DSM 1251) TaxID=326298 RepID=Q30S23_SULDN|nr:HD domain-containing phosphohydrolase [Sulfurimonas denitrificans]ABB44208.1 metal dependent phosphohydrolase [Sulfurimonas denitrificans DSM 1251]MDD3443603.1 GAF domain-containing protein [Sulfurimonas denitrificans]